MRRLEQQRRQDDKDQRLQPVQCAYSSLANSRNSCTAVAPRASFWWFDNKRALKYLALTGANLPLLVGRFDHQCIARVELTDRFELSVWILVAV